MDGKYYELQLKINPDIEDIVSDICFEMLPCEGVVLAEEAYKDLEMISSTEGTLRVFLAPENDCSFEDMSNSVKTILHKQREILKTHGLSDEELGSWEFSLFEKENEDWSKKWKEKWDVTSVSERITVVPDWIDYVPKRNDEVIIKLEPGCAFGTGTHATTQLCMKSIEKYMKPGSDVADIGMGSGILAICAMKFGARSAYGCDNDETVIDVAKVNAVKNGIKISTSAENLENACFFELNTADKIQKTFDFVLANILHNVLADIMGDLKKLMKDDAFLVLSGILDEKKTVVIEAVKKHNLIIAEEIHQNQWVAFVVKK